MTDQINSEKLEEKEEMYSLEDENIDNSISENNFDWDFILDREWSRTKQ